MITVEEYINKWIKKNTTDYFRLNKLNKPTTEISLNPLFFPNGDINLGTIIFYTL